MVEVREKFVKTNGVRLHVVEAGPRDGPMIMFLHGFPEFWYAWRRQIDYFAERGYLVVAPDQRGYNVSDKPVGIESYKMDELAKDVIGLIHHYGRARIFLAGHDWGAAVSWWSAIKYPEQIERLVIMNVPHPKVMSANLFSNPRQMHRSWYIFFFQLPEAPERFAAANDYAWPLGVLADTSRPGTFTPDDLARYREAFSQPGAFSAMLNWYRAFLQTKSDRPASFRVKIPTLVLWGVKDIAIIPEQAEQSMEYCDQGRLIKFEEATHWVQHEEADKVNGLLEKFFLGENDPS